MTEKRTVTDEELDLLAEGELSVEQRADLFRRLDEQPSQWKNCALAILEAKALRVSLRGGFEDQANSMNGRALSVHASEDILKVGRTKPQAATWESHGRSPIPRQNGNPVVWMLGVAVLLALTTGSLVGYRFGQSWSTVTAIPKPTSEPAPDQTNLIESQESPLQTAAQKMLAWLNIGDEELLAVVCLDEGDNARFIPIVSSKTLADQLMRIPTIPPSPEQIQLANHHGWNILQYPQLIAIDRPKAKPEIVPVQMVRYKFAGRDAI